MSTTKEYELWYQGTIHFENGNRKEALECMARISPYSKVLFNMGVITQEYKVSEALYTQSIQQDEYLCVGYVQKGYCRFMLCDYSFALKCFLFALELLLDNDFIDYEPLGLDYKVYRYELLFNISICYYQIGKEKEYQDCYLKALKCCKTREQSELIEKSYHEYTIFHLSNKLFKIPDVKVKNFEKKNFLMDAKVVIANEEEFLGFSGALLLKPVLESNGATLVRKKSKRGEVESGGLQRNDEPGLKGDVTNKDSQTLISLVVKTSSESKGASPKDTGTKKSEKVKPIYIIPRMERRPSNIAIERSRSTSSLHEASNENIYPPNALSFEQKRVFGTRNSSLSRPGKNNSMDRSESSLKTPAFASEKVVAPQIVSTPTTTTASGIQTKQTDFAENSGYEDNTKTMIKVHTELNTIGLQVQPTISVLELTNMIVDVLSLDHSHYETGRDKVKLCFVDKEDPDTMVSIIDDTDLQLAIDNTSKTVHLYLDSNDVLDMY